MAIKVKLLVDDEIFNVLNYSIRLNQGADNTGRPTQRTVFKHLILTVESSKDTDFHIWMLEKNLTKNIELHLEPDILGTRIRKIKLYDAHLIALNTNFSSTSEEPLSETLTITAAGLEDSFSAGVYSSSWRVTYPQEETTATTIEEESKELEKRIYDLKWIKEEVVVKNSRILKVVTLQAKVENIEEGEEVDLTLTRHLREVNEIGKEVIVDTEFDTLSGVVKNSKVEIVWEIEDDNKK